MPTSDDLLEAIRSDHRSGATALTRRAAEAFRHRLAEDDPLMGFGDFADRLTAAQPAMASIRNLAERAKAAARVGSIANARRAIEEFGEELDASTERIARQARPVLADVDRVVTISASSAVAAALRDAHAAHPGLSVVCSESRPLNEGLTLAQSLAEHGVATTVCTDALAPSLVRDADVVLVGGDALAPEGLVNKIGTFPLALAARHVDVPCIALVSRLKVLPRFDDGWIAEMAPSEVAEVDAASARVVNRHFDITPLDLVSHVVTEDGVIDDLSHEHALFG